VKTCKLVRSTVVETHHRCLSGWTPITVLRDKYRFCVPAAGGVRCRGSTRITWRPVAARSKWEICCARHCRNLEIVGLQIVNHVAMSIATVTGVSTSATCTLNLGPRVLGSTGTSTPLRREGGQRGPAWWAAMAARHKSDSRAVTKRPHGPTKLDGVCGWGPGPGPETTCNRSPARPRLHTFLAPAPTNQRLCYQGECT